MDLLIYCAGGFGIEMMDVARRANALQKRWGKIGFIDDVHTENFYYGADLYPFACVKEHFAPGSFEVVIANGEPFARKALYDKLKASGMRLATLVDPSAVVSDTARLAEGAVVCPHAFIAPEAVLRANVAVNVGAIACHNALIGENCFLSLNVSMGGNCSVGPETFIGIGAQIMQATSIGGGTIIGMGAVVTCDIPDGVVALGCPAKVIRSNTEKKVFKNSRLSI